MELLSILNPPIIDIFNDPRLTFEELTKKIDENHESIIRQVGDVAKQIKPADIKPIEGMMFALLQHHLLIATTHTKLTARQAYLSYVVTQLNRTLERLTK